MNDLLARISIGDVVPDIETGTRRTETEDEASEAAELSKFFQEVETLKKEMSRVRDVLMSLQVTHEESKTAQQTGTVRALRERINRDIGEVTKRSRSIKSGIESLNASNVCTSRVEGRNGNSTHRTRIQVTNTLTETLRELMHDFVSLRSKILDEYKEIISRSYFTVTGQKADEATLDRMAESGEGETIYQKAIEQQGKVKAAGALYDVEEQHKVVKDIERNLKELNQIFIDLSVLVESQGALVNDIQANVERADSYTKRAAEQLQDAKHLLRRGRICLCMATSVSLLVGGIVAAVVGIVK